MALYRVYQRDLITGHLDPVAELNCEFDFEATTLARRHLGDREGEVRENLRLVRRLEALSTMSMAS